jgi:hypothetical protein
VAEELAVHYVIRAMPRNDVQHSNGDRPAPTRDRVDGPPTREAAAPGTYDGPGSA